MAKTQQERLLEKQLKQAKDAQRKQEREARKAATRDRAASIVNGQPIVEGLRILDETAEEALRCLLQCDRSEENRISFTDEVFPLYIQMSSTIELEKLVQYGMIGGLISYDMGGFCYLLPPAITYFENKERALAKQEGVREMHTTKNELKKLIDRGQTLQDPTATAGITLSDCAKWTQDVRTYNERILKKHPVYQPLKDALFFNKIATILGCLQSVYEDDEFWLTSNAVIPTTTIERVLAMYDVFVSHANKDKIGYVNELKASLDKLGVSVFYDKDTLEWGDNWKDKILEGVEKAEFAIIVISENFFGREWTEIELTEFLSRQNRNGQKIILPILHGISVTQIQEKYPAVAEIQALDSSKYSCDEIALKFAGQLIKRLKS